LLLAVGAELTARIYISTLPGKTVALLPSMQALRRVSRRPKANDAPGTAAGRSSGANGRDGHTETGLLNLFTRILRTAKSKKNLRHLRSKSESDTATALEKPMPISMAAGHATPGQVTGADICTPLGHSDRDCKLTTGGEKRSSLPSAEHAQQPASGPSLEAPSPAAAKAADDKAARPVVLPAQAPVTYPEGNISPGFRPGLRESADHLDYERPATAATADSVPLIDPGVAIEAEDGVGNQLQPAPSTTPQRHHQTEASSDFQDFLHEAGDGDRQEREQLWEAITSRPGKKKFVPDHPDLMDLGAGLERSGTFGKASRQKESREPKEPKKKDSPWRTSFYGAKSRDDQRPDASGPVQRRRSSAARRLSDYFKPSRESIG
jgi:hypothetical protein